LENDVLGKRSIGAQAFGSAHGARPWRAVQLAAWEALTKKLAEAAAAADDGVT